MGNLTIDQILAEKRLEESPELYGIEKEASSQPNRSSDYSYEDIEKMASILEEGEVHTEQSSSYNEKLAAALILSDCVNSLYGSILPEKTASEKKEDEPSEKESKKEDSEEDEETKTAAAKVAQLIVAADENGVPHEEICEFLEKKAFKAPDLMKGIRSLLGSNVAKGTAGAGVVAGAGYAGNEYGEHTTEEKAKKVLPKILRLGQVQGYRMGARKGFEAGAHATNNAWQQRLKAKLGNKE